jgi:hypothetical protein
MAVIRAMEGGMLLRDKNAVIYRAVAPSAAPSLGRLRRRSPGLTVDDFFKPIHNAAKTQFLTAGPSGAIWLKRGKDTLPRLPISRLATPSR